MPGEDTVASRQMDGIAGAVVRPPYLALVRRAMGCVRLGSPSRGLLVAHGSSRHRVHQDVEPGLADPAEEVEVLQAEEPLRVGDDAGVEHRARQQRGAPSRHVDRDQLVRPPARGDHVLGMGPSSDEPPSVRHHRPDLPARLPAKVFGPSDDVGQSRTGKGKEPDIVLAQVRPANRWVGEGRLYPDGKSPRGSEISWQSHEVDTGLERHVVEPARAVDHDDHPIWWKAFLLDERAHHIGGQTWPPVCEHDRGDRGRKRWWWRREATIRSRLASPRPHLDRLTTDVEATNVERFCVADERGGGESNVSGDEEGAGGDPPISVVVAVLNGMPWIEHQLEALSTQDVPCDWEVIVADNGSQDATAACVRAWTERDPRFRLVDASARSGAGAARNIGVQAARGHNLAFCDADDVVQPGWLAGLVATLAEADVVAGVFDFGSLNGRPPSNPIPAGTRQMGFLPFALGANLAVSRDAFETVGGFCETIPPSEDTDLSWRLQLAGYQFAVSSAAAVAKRDHAAGMPSLRAAWHYGLCAPLLFRQYRRRGMKRDLRLAVKTWVWLVVASPGLFAGSVRRRWVRSFGERAGRLAGSVRYRAFFP